MADSTSHLAWEAGHLRVRIKSWMRIAREFVPLGLRRGSESNRRLLASIVRPATPGAHPRPLFDRDCGWWPPVTFGAAFVGQKSGGTRQFMADRLAGIESRV